VTANYESGFLAERYDDLRDEVLNNPTPSAHGFGLAIIFTQGLVPWMRAWNSSVPLNPSKNSRPLPKRDLPCNQKHEIIQLVANMVMNRISSPTTEGVTNAV
jgi:hypothetical protein